MRIAFIGLGNMGSGMAANLVRAGHSVQAFDLSESALAVANDAGCDVFASAVEAVLNVDAVISMLPNGNVVEQFYTKQVFGHAPVTALLLDCSTIDVATARSVTAAAADAGYVFLDAPVSGGIAAASAGSLTFMVGGDREHFEKAEPILSAMGKVVIHAGAAGAGQAAKACNNMILGATMVATCEAFVLAQKLGLDPKIFYDIASVSSGQSWSMTSYCPVKGVGPVTPADKEYQGGFAAALMLKDLRLAMQAADNVGAYVPMGAHARDLYETYVTANADKDFSGIIEMLKEHQ